MPEDKVFDDRGRIIRWVTLHQRIARLIVFAVSLVVVLAILPDYIRIVFWSGFKSNPLLLGMLIIFSVLAISLVWSAGQRLDAWVFFVFNLRGSRPIWLDRVMLGFTQIGSALAALGIALILFLAGDRLAAYELVLGAVSLWMVVELLKFVVYRSRPFIRLTQARIVGARAIGRSFPSGHTSQVFFIATLMTQHFHLSFLAALLLYTIAFLVGITRMYVGAHYPRDVLGGAILGSAWGLLGAIIDEYILSGVR